MYWHKCPRGCPRVFQSAENVRQHLDADYSRCYNYSQELFPFAEAVGRAKRGRFRPPHDDEDDQGYNSTASASTSSPPSRSPAPDGTGASDPADATPAFLQKYLFEYHTEYFAGSGMPLPGKSATFIDRFNTDILAEARRSNIYFPFSTKGEWELGSFLMRSNLSISAINELLSLSIMDHLNLSFRSAKTLRSWMEQLPKGPQWFYKAVETRHPTKRPLYVYYRDVLECIEAILQNPLITDHISYSPMRVYRSAQHTVRVYSEWLSGSAAWEAQASFLWSTELMLSLLPEGATLLGIILSSDKTNITAMTGNRAAHPLLMSLANLDLDFRGKSSNNAFLLLSLLPIPKFIEADGKGVLEARVTHQVLDLVLEPAKQAAKIGYMLDDAFGRSRYSFPALAGYITDLPEAQLISCVGTKSSPMSIARYNQLGDPQPHELRTQAHTLQELKKIKTDPWELHAYIKAAKGLGLNSVHKPFWRNWSTSPLADPTNFINPDPLHHWHKAFYDHDLRWCINALGAQNLDFRYSILHHHVGFRHFPEGISQLKQCTGREHRDFQRYIIAVIADVVSSDFLVAVRALCDFRYRAQARILDDDDLNAIDSSLKEFHEHRDAIIEAKARLGKKGPIYTWYIPKFETLQHVTRCARTSGVPSQFSTERTENEHINTIKRPARKTNNQNHDQQICRHLDRIEKIRMFEVATEVRAAAAAHDHDFTQPSSETGNEDDSSNQLETIVKNISLTAFEAKHSLTDYFQKALELKLLHFPPLGPLRTFVVHSTAIHVKQEYCFVMTVEEAAQKFQILDLESALSHYMACSLSDTVGPYSIGGRRRYTTQGLPFKRIGILTKCQIQNKGFHPPYSAMPATTLTASPPAGSWRAGRFDPVIININENQQWPYTGLQGHCVAQLCLIMLPLANNDLEPLPSSFCRYLTYSRRFDIVPQINPQFSVHRGPFPDPKTSFFVLRRACRTNGDPMGDIIPLRQLRSPANLVPKFHEPPHAGLTGEMSLAAMDVFYLNKYFTKELFYALTIPLEYELPTA